jgi:hypothetical protein
MKIPLSIGYLLQDSMPDYFGNEGAKRHIFAVIDRLRASIFFVGTQL